MLKKSFAQDHTIIKCQNWNMNPDLSVLLTTVLYNSSCLLFMLPM